ncbi:forkhead box protein N3 [Saccoglossus kowalevskii]|uniref:Forkhead box protein N3 n=2 Tax=Saccoglossus kowalevskii TaxID=10224 RepID=A0ABM0MQ61_SACKO|nr:PREDICTED: forkhead box protein N3 [Saccoglossus kowalevskii]
MPPNRKPGSVSALRRVSQGLSHSFPSATLSRALGQVDRKMDLSSSCFAAIRMEKGAIDDEELTSLSWLHSSDLLKNMNGTDLENDPLSKENDVNGLSDRSGNLNLAHPPNAPYDAKQQLNSKPPFSFSCLIFMAVEDSPNKRLPVKDIYQWILDHFPYFQNAPTGWKNSVRHNLSLNKCFKKVEKEKGQTIGKGSLWCIDPEYRPNLLQALKKTPYHPYHHIFTTPPQSPHSTPLSTISSISNTQGLFSSSAAHLPIFQHILQQNNQRLHQGNHRSIDDTEADAAATMMTLTTPPDQRAAEHARLKQETTSLSSASQLSKDFQKWTMTTTNNTSVFRQQLRPWSINNNVQDKRKPRMTSTPLMKARSKQSTPPCNEDHTYSMTSSISVPTENGSFSSEEDPLESDGSDFTDETDSEMEHDGKILRHFDSGYINDDGFDEELKPIKLVCDSSLPIKKRVPRANFAEEEMRIVEGADALLNLAGIKTTSIPIRSISPIHNNSHSAISTATTS